MIPYVEDKIIDWDDVKRLLESSRRFNHWTNFGPVSLMLESSVPSPKGMGVVATSSGTTALFAAVQLQNHLAGRDLRWCVSSFGFPCTRQGPLKDAWILDCDQEGMIALDDVPPWCEGLVVTNVFGGAKNLGIYSRFCEPRGIKVVFDCASAIGDAPIVGDTIYSFHQTKPWGMGEGGCLITADSNVPVVRSLLNFGLMGDVGCRAGNGKMSDISASFILSRFEKLSDYSGLYRDQFDRIARIGVRRGWRSLCGGKTPACVPLVWHNPVTCLDNHIVTLKKYFVPIAETRHARHLHDRIVNFPCHPGIAEISDSEIDSVLSHLEKQPLLPQDAPSHLLQQCP